VSHIPFVITCLCKIALSLLFYIHIIFDALAGQFRPNKNSLYYAMNSIENKDIKGDLSSFRCAVPSER